MFDDLHTDSSPESDAEDASFNSETYNEDMNTSNSFMKDIVDNGHKKAKLEMQDFLRQWAIKHKVKGSALSDLLSHLNKYSLFSALPKDARTLLQTPRKCEVIDVPPGKYCHFGLSNGIKEILRNDLIREKCKLQGVQIAIGIDGLPLSKSSSSTFWPILGNIFPGGHVFIIGIYHGYFKPESSTLFLRTFVNEALFLYEHKIEIDGMLVPFSIKLFIMDAPAKSFVLNIKGHTGYYSCTKCNIKGLNDHGRVYFIGENVQKRTDEEFRTHKNNKFHLGISELERLTNIDMIACFPLDYMHLICLGVMRKLMYLWLGTNQKRKIWQLSFNQITRISNILAQIKPFVPIEFARKPRSLTMKSYRIPTIIILYRDSSSQEYTE